MAGQPRPIKYQFDADATQFGRGVNQARADLQRLERTANDTDRALDLDVDVDDSALGLLRRRLLETRAQLERDIEVDVDLDAGVALAQLRRIERQLNQLDRMRVDVDVDVDRDRISRQFGGLGRYSSGIFAGAFAGGVGAALGGAGALGAAAAPRALVGFATPQILAGVPYLVTAFSSALGAGLSAAIAKTGYELLEAVTPYEAASRKFETVFGGQTKTIEEWAKAVSVRGGVATREIQALSASVQDLLVPRGFSRSEAAEYTQQIVERGIALAEFSGADKAYGIESVTKALLGEREQLKSLGVQVRQSDVNGWLEDNADKLKGLTDGQKEVVATLSLIEARSSDAWKSYLDGGSNAEQALDSLRSTFGNLRDEFIIGFGGIFGDLIGEIGEATGAFETLAEAPEGLSTWIKENREGIRDFMLQLVDFALLGAQGFGLMAETIFNIADRLASIAPTVLRFTASMLDATEKMEALNRLFTTDIGSEEFKAAWRDLTSDASDRVKELERTADEMENSINGWDFSGAKEAVSDMNDRIGQWREDIEGLRRTEWYIDFRAELTGASQKEVRQAIKNLTAPQLAEIIASTEGSDSKVDKQLNKAAEKRYAQIIADPQGVSGAESTLAYLARNRYASLFLTVRQSTYRSPSNPIENLIPNERSVARTPRVSAQALASPADPYFSPLAAAQSSAARRTLVLSEGQGGSNVTEIRPKREAVKVYLDGAEIASHLDLSARRLATATTRRA